MSALHRLKPESMEEKSFAGSLLKRRKVGKIVNYWSHVDCLLNFSIKVFEYRIHDSQRDFCYIDLQDHREKIDGSAMDPGEKVIEILEDKIIIRNARDTSGHLKSAILLKPVENSADFDNWKAAFRRIVRFPAIAEKCALNSLPVFLSSVEGKNLLDDILAGNQVGSFQSSLDDVWGLIQLRNLQYSLDDVADSFEKVCCTVSFGDQSIFCDQPRGTTQSCTPFFPLFKRFFISSRDSSEILVCILSRSACMRNVIQFVGKLYLWDVVRQLSTPSLSAVRTSTMPLYSPGSNLIFGTATLSYVIEYLGNNVSSADHAEQQQESFARDPVLKPEFFANDSATITKQIKDVMGSPLFERLITADEIASLCLTLRVMRYPMYTFSPSLDLASQNEFYTRVFCIDSSIVTRIGESNELCHCPFSMLHKEAIFVMNSCCYHPSYTLDAFGGSPARLLSWQYQVYSQSWLANFARISQHGESFCNVKLQAVEQIDAASFVSREYDDQNVFASRFPSKAIGNEANFEVTVMHDLNANPERTLKILGQNLSPNILNRFQNNLIPLQGLRGNLIFFLRDRVRPFKLRSWGALQVNLLIDQKPCTQWVHLQKYEDASAPSKKEKIFSEGYAVLVTISLCFDRESIHAPCAALEPSEFIAPPKFFSDWLSAHPHSHVMGSCERSRYLHYMFQILCRRMISFVAQLKIHGDFSVSWSSIPWNPELPFPREVHGILTCFAHTHGVAPIFFHLQLAQELSDALIISNYHNYSFIKLAVECLSNVLLLGSGISDSDFAWFQTLTITIFQSASRSLYNFLCRGKVAQLDLMIVMEGYVSMFSNLNAVKTGISMIQHAILKGIPAHTTAIGLSSQVGDFSIEHLTNMVVQDFVSLADSICLQTFSQSSDDCLLPFPGVYIGQQFLDILEIFNDFLRQWEAICQDRESSKLVGCAVLGFYRRIICNAVDLRISSTLRGHDVLELWHLMQKIHSSLARNYAQSVPHGSFTDFTKLLAPIWLQTLPETATALAFSVCRACKIDNLDVCDEQKRISSSVIDGLQSSGIIVHEMQFVSQKCLTIASDQLRLRMMMGLVRIPIRAAHELQMWIQKTFLEILSEAYAVLRSSHTSKISKLTNQLCILCNDLAFLKDSVLVEAEGWTRYYEDLVSGSSFSRGMPKFKSDSVVTDDKAGFGPGPVQVIVTTGSTVGSGTDSDVFIIVHGIQGSESSGKQQLKSDGDTFEAGCVDTFSIDLAEALHQISKIELFLEGSDAWTVDTVEINCPQTKKSAMFQCFCKLQSSDNHQEFINKELESNSKCWSGSPMESAFVVTSRKCTLIQRDQLSKITKLLISSWKFLELADEITGIGATSMGNEIAELGECLFEAIKAGLKNLHLVCCSKVLSMLTAMLFEESAFTLLKVLLNLSDEARNDVQLVFDESRKDESFGGNLMNFATKVQAAGLAIGSFAKKAAVTTFMGDTLAKTLLSRSKASLAILQEMQRIFQVYQNPLPSSAVHTANDLRWVLNNCTLPSSDFISMHSTLACTSKRAKMIVVVLQSRSRDLEAEMFLQALKTSTDDKSSAYNQKK